MNMRAELDRLLLAHVLRVGRPEANLLNESIDGALSGLEVNGIANRVGDLARGVRRRAVVNPSLMDMYGLHPWFFLASGRTGRFNEVIRATKQVDEGVSHHVLYGDLDSLIVLYGSEQEANLLYGRLEGGAYEEPAQMYAERVLLVKGFPPVPLPKSTALTREDEFAVNALVEDYDDPSVSDVRQRLLDEKLILGSAWDVPASAQSPVRAFVGIRLGGRRAPSPDEVLRTVLGSEIVASVLSDLFQVTPPLPFLYLAHLSCLSLTELDAATNALSLLRIRDVDVKCTTLVIASGAERPPRLRAPEVSELPVGMATREILRTSEGVFASLGRPEQQKFNSLDGEQQVRFAGNYSKLDSVVGASITSDKTRAELRSAIDGLGRAVLTSPTAPATSGPVLGVLTRVEYLSRELLGALVDIALPDRATAQKEFKLPTRKLSGLSLGQVAVAFRAAGEHPAFAAYSHILDEDSLNAVEELAKERNLWAHGAKARSPGPAAFDEAARVLLHAVEVLEWIERSLQAVPPRRSKRRLDRRPDFFISHASEDKPAAARPIYEGLTQLGYRVWLDETELVLGDSLRESIDAAVAACRFGVVILSDAFFKKSWPQEELNGLFARQMRGRKTILPVWHDVDHATVAQYTPMISDKVAASTVDGIPRVVEAIVAAFEKAAREG